MSQLALPLAWPADPGDNGFLVSASNRDAVQLLEDWTAWPVRTALLVGPRRSGRSLIARIFARKSGGVVMDDAQRAPEEALFHAWNRAEAAKRPLLLVAEKAPPIWEIALPDLRSRVAASPLAQIGPPDDPLMRALVERGLAGRGLDARPELIDWVASRIERSYDVIAATIAALDAAAMERRRGLSIPLARTTLTEAGLLHTAEDP